MEMFGYQGVIALIDLTAQTIDRLEFDEELARKYIGGSGLGTYYLTRFGIPAAGPLDPGNPLIYMTGPLLGTGAPTSGRHQILARSPLTGCFGEADCGGSFGFHLKRAGFDGLVITGSSDRPVVLVASDDDISFVDGRHLWGKDTFETEEILSREMPWGIGVSCIGPAGEKCVSLAGIFHDGHHARAAGRGGLGAVMGSKKLKAIVAKGTRMSSIAKRNELNKVLIESNNRLKEKGAGLRLYGTAAGMENAEKLGDLPIRNWKQGSWPEEAKALSGQEMANTILTGDYGCIACPMRCGRLVNLGGVEMGGPEYETIGMLGSACLVGDLESVAKANELCNRYGLDTISTGATIAFAMEAYEKGILTKDEAGMEISWGDAGTMLDLIRLMGNKEGIGAILGMGTRKAAEHFGGDAHLYAIHSKGLELPAHDPRCFKGLASGFALSPRGACHLSSFTYPWERSAVYPEFGYEEVQDRTADEGKGIMTARFQDLMAVADSLKICKFALSVGTRVEELAQWLSMTTGWDMSSEELLLAGERIFTLKRLYNATLGMDRRQDTLPERILKQPRGTGGSAETVPDLEKQLDEYYRFRGWTEEGIPTEETRVRLGLGDYLTACCPNEENQGERG